MVISVAAGKGGTGKTLVAVNLALALCRNGISTVFADCDVEEPNAHLFLNPRIIKREEVAILIPKIHQNRCDRCGECSSFCPYGALAATPSSLLVFEELCHGCGGCALVCPREAISEEERILGVVEEGRTVEDMDFFRGILDIGEPKASVVVSGVKKRLPPDKVNVVDCGPGTGCPVITAVHGSDLCIMVTEPTPFGLHDLSMAVNMAELLRVPSLVVLNKDIPGDNLARRFCEERGLEIALSIPFSMDIARFNARGINLVDTGVGWMEQFIYLYRRAMEKLHSQGEVR